METRNNTNIRHEFRTLLHRVTENLLSKSRSFDPLVGERISGIEERIIDADPLTKDAIEAMGVISFQLGMISKMPNVRDKRKFAEVRVYKVEGGVFEYLNDPIAPGCIVESRLYLKGQEEPKRSFHYITDEKDSKGHPIIYSAHLIEGKISKPTPLFLGSERFLKQAFRSGLARSVEGEVLSGFRNEVRIYVRGESQKAPARRNPRVPPVKMTRVPNTI